MVTRWCPFRFCANFLANDRGRMRRKQHHGAESVTAVCCEHRDHWAAEIHDFLAAGFCGFSQNIAPNQRAVADLWKHLFLWNHSNVSFFCHCKLFLVHQKSSNPHWQALLYSLTPILCSQLWLQTSLCSLSLSPFPWSWWSSARRNSLGSRLTLYASIEGF